MSTRTATCAWCGATFPVESRPGPVPRYCRASHRQRAHEARRHAATLTGAVDTLAAARAAHTTSGAPSELLAAIDTVLAVAAHPNPSRDEIPANRHAPAANPSRDECEPASPSTPPPRRSPRSRLKPWKAVRHAVGEDPTITVEWVYSAHTTETAARRAAGRLARQAAQRWDWNEYSRWRWTVIHDPDGTICNPSRDDSHAASQDSITTVPPQGGAIG